MRNYLQWCKSTRGQNFGNGVCFGLSCGVFAALYFPDTYLLHKWKELVQCYEYVKLLFIIHNYKEDLLILLINIEKLKIN